MIRKRLGGTALLLVLVLGGSVGGVVWSLSQVPDFYAQALSELPDPQDRKQAAKQFVERTLRLVDGVEHEDAWAEEFTQQQINSWLAEELHQKHAKLLPNGVSDPRVQFAPEAVQLGFQFQREGWEGVISVRARPWVPQENQLALEIESVKAGLMPIPLDRVLQEISRQFETEGWRVTWREAHGHDVLVISLDGGGAEQPVLEAVEVVEGAVRVRGRRSVTTHPVSTGKGATGEEPSAGHGTRVADQPVGDRSGVK